MISRKPFCHQPFRDRSFPDDLVPKIFCAENSIKQHTQVMTRGRIAMQVETASWFEDAMKFDQARRHHREIRHHGRMFQETVERFHQLDHGDIRAVVDELMVGVGGVACSRCR